MSKTFQEAKTYKSKYWKNKPVMKFDEKTQKTTQIKTHEELAKKYDASLTQLPIGYTWNKVDVNNTEQMKIISDFLTQYYRRGTESTYIVQYTPEKLAWEFGNNGYFMYVVNTEHQHVPVGVIGFAKRNIQLYENSYQASEPLYMCISDKYKHAGLAKVLMDEVTRVSVADGIDAGISCNNILVHQPVATVRQYSRPINYKKLRENDFVDIAGVDEELVHAKTRINLKPSEKYKVAEKNSTNIDIVHGLYAEYMKSFNLHLIMSKEDVAHYMFDERYVKTVLIYEENSENNMPVDFVTYRIYDIINTNKTENNIVTAADLFIYSSLIVNVDIMFINILKHISANKIQIVYINDMMHSNDIILSNERNIDYDTDDDDENATYDMHILKTGRKYFIGLFNLRCETMKQNMVSWLIF